MNVFKTFFSVPDKPPVLTSNSPKSRSSCDQRINYTKCVNKNLMRNHCEVVSIENHAYPFKTFSKFVLLELNPSFKKKLK